MGSFSAMNSAGRIAQVEALRNQLEAGGEIRARITISGNEQG
jgi:hypothetical protein